VPNLESLPRPVRGSTEGLVVLTTVGSEEQAVQLAEALIERRLAACVNIQPAVRSIYRWKDRVWNDLEVLLFIKTTRARYPGLADAIRALHSYELPEIIAIPVAAADPRVLAWMAEVTRPEQGED
jgi:periplasmic divalent cation tolerance protein